jgi:DNA-binding MarR family transcriptional regulator
MSKSAPFDLKDFLPYLLNQAADVSSRGFEGYYKSKYGLLRTEWRVIFHLGRYGSITAKEICDRARIHKTKVSRAVHALEVKRFLKRTQVQNDRRQESLELTASGTRVFEDLYQESGRFDAELISAFSEDERAILRRLLAQIAGL